LRSRWRAPRLPRGTSHGALLTVTRPFWNEEDTGRGSQSSNRLFRMTRRPAPGRALPAGGLIGPKGQTWRFHTDFRFPIWPDFPEHGIWTAGRRSPEWRLGLLVKWMAGPWRVPNPARLRSSRLLGRLVDGRGFVARNRKAGHAAAEETS
jgi:hypothetical protein